MQPRKLYYEDCHIQTFCARVTGCDATEKGYAVTLDATAFYPEGGGQPCDFGTVGDAKVLDVFSRDEQVIHLCDKSLEIGREVVGQIDYTRRFDLMQQHTGEHIVSGIIHQRYGYHNVGFHMGAELITIDFDGIIPQEDLEEIEQCANHIIWQNLPVEVFYPSPEDLPHTVYRSKRALPWPVRIVKIGDTDTCACCGVHVAATGEVGFVKLLSCVKFHQGVRIEMACGGRALNYLSRIYCQNRLVSQTFSAKPLETGAAAQAVSEALAKEKFQVTQLNRQIFSHIAQGFAGKGNVTYFTRDITPGQVRELAEMVAETCGGICLVACGSDEAGYQICMAGTSSLEDRGKRLAQSLGGKGGGKGSFFQGSVPAPKEAIEAVFCSVCQ